MSTESGTCRKCRVEVTSGGGEFVVGEVILCPLHALTEKLAEALKHTLYFYCASHCEVIGSRDPRAMKGTKEHVGICKDYTKLLGAYDELQGRKG